jgi:nucleotide-binding universal stress UspA family protein
MEKIVNKKKINLLLAIDFSPESKQTFAIIKHLEKAYDIIISLIHVIPSYWKLWFYSDAYKEEIMARLQSFREEFLTEQKVKKLVIKIGNPADNILQTAISTQANLIVLGHKIQNEKTRYSSKTTIRNTIRAATQNVLICKNDRPFNKIIVGIDRSSSSKRIIAWSLDLALRLNAKLHFLTILEKANFNPLGLTERQLKKAEKKYQQEAEAVFDNLLKIHDFSQIKMEKIIKWGPAADTILNLAEDKSYDLIIIGAKGHSKLRHVLLGSTAEKIVTFTPCSLLVVR